MKRYQLLIVAIAIAAIMAFSLIGCGGDTDKAKEYMEKGDELTLALETESMKLTDELMALTTDYIAGKNTEPAGVTAKVEEIKNMASAMESNGGKAMVEYEKILGLKGVDDYVRYANMQIEVLQIMKDEALKNCNGILDIIMTSVNTGEPPDTNKLMEYVADATTMGKEAIELDNQAEELKVEENL